jgi:hypothetical protein
MMLMTGGPSAPPPEEAGFLATTIGTPGVGGIPRGRLAERRKDKGALATERPFSDAVRERPPPGDRRALR